MHRVGVPYGGPSLNSKTELQGSSLVDSDADSDFDSVQGSTMDKVFLFAASQKKPFIIDDK
jgi:hypothetical protein